MEDAITENITAIFGTGLVALLVFVIFYFLLNPEKVEKWASMIYRLLSVFPRLFRSARRNYVKYDLQGRINNFSASVGDSAPYLAEHRVAIEWVDPAIDREAFLRDGAVVLRLRAVDPEDMNFVMGAYMFVSTSLLHRAKRYLSKSHRESIDLFITTKILQREKEHVVDIFLEKYLHPKTEKVDSKIVTYFDTYGRMETRGLFYSIYLRELDYLGRKVFGQRRDDQILIEVNRLIEFLDRVATRHLGETEVDLDFKGTYCRFSIVIVGRRFNITPGGEVWARFIQSKLAPQEMETIYLVCPPEHEAILEEIAKTLGAEFERVQQARFPVTLTRRDAATGEVDEFKSTNCLLALRRRDVDVFQTSTRGS